MFLLGLLSLVQILFLPGFLVLKLLKVKSDSLIQRFLYTFGISLSVNYFLVCLLVFLRIYIDLTIFIIFFIELFVFIYFWVKGRVRIHLNRTIKEYYANLLNYIKNLVGIHRFLFILFALLLLFFTSLIFVNATTTYYFFDTIRIKMWAQTWASNNFMIYSHYPQLTATNSSITYLFINNDTVDFFSKAIMPLFFIGILLIFLDLYLRTKSIVHLTSFILYSYILLVFYGILFISDLNNDIPVSFFSFLSFYVILTRNKNTFDNQAILLAAFFAITAANTKLVGLYTVALSGIWIVFYLYRNKNSIPRKDLIKTFSILGVIYIVGLFWYLIFPLLMSQGVGASPYRPFDGLIDSFFYGLHLITVSFGKLFSVLILISLIAGLFTRARNIILFVISPLFFIWAFWYSYDCRNLSLIIPFTAYAAGYGLVFIVKKTRDKLTSVKILHPNRAYPEKSLKFKSFYSVLIIISLLLLLFTINSKFIFNLGMDTAYFLRSFYFDFTTLVFTSELGYYRYVEYYVNTISLLILLTIVLFTLKGLNIKMHQLIILLFAAIVILNFILPRNSLLRAQKDDENLVKVHNLYFEMHSYLKKYPGTILTNSLSFEKLIFPAGIKIKYTQGINEGLSPNEIRYILVDKAQINGEKPDTALNNYRKLIETTEFEFFTLHSP